MNSKRKPKNDLLKVMAISIGNSRISSAVIQGDGILSRISVDNNDDSALTLWRQWIKDQDGKPPMAAVSVNPSRVALLEKRLGEKLPLVGRDIPMPIQDLTLTPETTGHDRLIACYAASLIYGRPALVVDFGTAFTFNLIDRAGAFVGGAIVPGLTLAASSLSTCAQLPQVPLDSQDPPLVGKDTKGAMLSGLLNGYLGLVEKMTDRFLEEGGAPDHRVATGGWAPFFVSRLSRFSSHDPDLLLRGVRLAYCNS